MEREGIMDRLHPASFPYGAMSKSGIAVVASSPCLHPEILPQPRKQFCIIIALVMIVRNAGFLTLVNFPNPSAVAIPSLARGCWVLRDVRREARVFKRLPSPCLYRFGNSHPAMSSKTDEVDRSPRNAAADGTAARSSERATLYFRLVRTL
ncbi:hypothetical protein AB1N83_013053 [Pleurotus pulmonarius]